MTKDADPTQSILLQAERLRDETRTRLNAETGRLSWPELERHFARGVVIRVAPGVDLVDVALAVSEDDKPRVEAWMSSGVVAHPSVDEAKLWVENQPEFWAVVVAPWVLIQEITAPER